MTENNVEVRVDALMPPEMAARAEDIGVKKAQLDFVTTFTLAVLAGAFIAMGAAFFITVVSGAQEVPYGVTRLLGGLAFCLGLILVVVAGAELFTGNNLIVMAWASGRVSTMRLLRNWLIVFVGNFAGALGTAALVFISSQYTFGGGAVGLTALAVGNAKVNLEFGQAIALGMLCNALVCLAVWLTFSARTTTDRILSILFPITAFVAAGFEHSVANMYFIPIALLIKQFAQPAFWTAIGKTAADYPALRWDTFLLGNLLPVTVGNLIGGALMVGVIYWFVYRRPLLGVQIKNK